MSEKFGEPRLFQSPEPGEESSGIEKNSINLRKLLNYNNPNRGEYETLVATEDSVKKRDSWNQREVDTAYAYMWDEMVYFPEYDEEIAEERQKYFRSKLKGEILVDAGGNESMLSFARNSGAKAYIDINKFLSGDDPASPFIDLAERESKSEKEGETDNVVVKADMLDVISRLPGDSVNHTLNGIGGELIRDGNYHQALANEILRTTKPGGLIFGRGSNALFMIDQDRVVDKTKELQLSSAVQWVVLEKKL